MCLLYRNLKEASLDLRLPHCWYRYGDEVVRYHMPAQIRWNHEDPRRTVVSWEGGEPVVENEDIIREIKEITERYHTREGLQQLVSEIYSTAPYEFQRRFREIYDIVFDYRNSRVEIKDFSKDVLYPRIERALEVFPEEDFREVGKDVEPLRRALRLLSRRDFNGDLDYIMELLENFWFYFACYLRVKAHENVPRSTVTFWRNMLPGETARYRRYFGDIMIELRELMENDDLLEDIIKKRLRWRKREERIIRELEKDLEGFEDFLAEYSYLPKGG